MPGLERVSTRYPAEQLSSTGNDVSQHRAPSPVVEVGVETTGVGRLEGLKVSRPPKIQEHSWLHDCRVVQLEPFPVEATLEGTGEPAQVRNPDDHQPTRPGEPPVNPEEWSGILEVFYKAEGDYAIERAFQRRGGLGEVEGVALVDLCRYGEGFKVLPSKAYCSGRGLYAGHSKSGLVKVSEPPPRCAAYFDE